MASGSIGAIAGCAASAGSLPTHHLSGSGPAALLTATLVPDGGCLYADSPESGTRFLPIWPSGFDRRGDSIVNGLSHVAMVGNTVDLGGGNYGESHEEFLRSLMDEELPEVCRIGNYWLVTAVASG